MPQLSADRYFAEIEASTAGLAEILAEYDQCLPIPTCPEWTLRQLVTHVGRAHRWAAEITRTARVLAGLKRDGWIETRRSGSHRVLVKGDQQRIWAYHDGVDLGGPALARLARDYGYSVDELRKL